MLSTKLLYIPGVVLILTGIPLAFFPAWLRRSIIITLPPLLLLHMWTFSGGDIHVTWLGYKLTLLHLSSTGLLFASVFMFALWAGSLFALQDASPLELGSAFIYAGGAIGICLCADWITLFCYWELMALSSTLIVWCGKQQDSWRAGLRYLLIHLAGGVALLAGIGALAAAGGSLELGRLAPGGYAYWLILAGILLNAGAPPFSFWVADAYPQASPSGMVFLSAFTTKTAVFVLITAFAGANVLIPIGIYMAIYGIIYALLEQDIRRILAYSIVNQVGFMLVAVGVGTPDTLNGAQAHAVAHILYKMVLLMGAGVIMRSLGTTKARELGGALWHKMPWTTACILVGAAASMGVPFTSSFVTKSVVLSGLADAGMGFVWVLMLVCSATVVFNAGGRFPWLALFAPTATSAATSKVDAPKVTDPKGLALFAMLAGALLCLVIGWFPQSLYSALPHTAIYQPYTFGHILEQVQILAVAGALFWLTRRVLYPSASITLDTDWFLRVAVLRTWQWFSSGLATSYAKSIELLTSSQMRSYMLIFILHGPRGILARSWYTGSIALWVAVMLASYIILYNLNAIPGLNVLQQLLGR
ncbi:MAG: proton-conducting transporter membrane subunit [Desulfuromonadaceae bacterium]|nr:proton-conducting transporter membrane subunit [Desulfuromonas sp.]MDY0185463.1 proton-conducting transporter membrane subunit [Desulfuromonadaceae bacterium]